MSIHSLDIGMIVFGIISVVFFGTLGMCILCSLRRMKPIEMEKEDIDTIRVVIQPFDNKIDVAVVDKE